MLYFGLISILFFLRYALQKQEGLRKQVYPLVLLSLFVFSAFRYKVGCDWSGNYFQFAIAVNFDWAILTRIQEPIWWAILGWIHENGFPYPVANIVSSAVFFSGIHVLARRQPDPLGFLVLLVPILIINMPMSGIRQGAAIGLMCMAFTSFIDRQTLRFGMWVVLASGFHSSAIVFVLLLPLVAGRNTRNRLIATGILAIPGVYFLALSEAAEVATGRYIGTGIDAAGSAYRVGLLAASGLYFIFVLRKKWLLAWPRDYGLVSIGAIGMMLDFIILPVSTVIGDRFGYYLIPIQMMIFARLPFLPFRKNAALHYALPYLGLIFVFFVWSQFSTLFQQCYIPYQTWVFGFPNGDPIGFEN